MKRHFLIHFSFLLALTAICIVLLDMAGFNGYSDLLLATGIGLYFLFSCVQRATYRLTFLIASILSIYCLLSYIPTGPGPMTERIGEWLYVILLLGIIQRIYSHLINRYEIKKTN